MSAYRPFVILSPLHRALRKIDMHLEERFTPLGFSVREAHLMGFLINNQPCTVGRLIDVFGLKNSTLTSMITRLEEKKMMMRKIHQDDKRSFEIQLTQEGRKAAQELYDITRALEDNILERLDEADKEHLRRITGTIEDVCAPR